MNALKQYGVTDRLLEDMVRLAIDNPDQHNTYLGKVKMSPFLLGESRFSKKLHDVLSLINIYNVNYLLLKPEVHTFIAVTSKDVNLPLKFEISKKEIKSVKEAYVKALSNFINIVKNI